MSLGFPKPTPRLIDRVAHKREREAKAAAFRKAVWARDGSKCRHCGRRVVHTAALVPSRGEVHHRRGRNVAPEDRFNVRAAVLLCGVCHRLPGVIAAFRKEATR